VTDSFEHPNGICFSPDEKTVYIADTGQQHGQSVNISLAASMQEKSIQVLTNKLFKLGGCCTHTINAGFVDAMLPT
jgi:sugar lactone lactonase YvrE